MNNWLRQQRMAKRKSEQRRKKKCQNRKRMKAHIRNGYDKIISFLQFRYMQRLGYKAFIGIHYIYLAIAVKRKNK